MFARIHHRAAVLMLATLCAVTANAAPNFTKYPLRVNILASNSGYYWNKPVLGGTALDVGSMAGGMGDTGAPAAPMGGGLSLNYDPVQLFYGEGKADLVTAPGIQGVTFTYDECLGRLGMTSPDKPFYARWKKANKVLELLVPLEPKLTKSVRKQATKYDKCDMYVAVQKNVFLLLRNGTIVSVTQDDLAKKPTLRQFTQGLDPKLMPRPAVTAPATQTRRRVQPNANQAPAASRPPVNPGSAASDSAPGARQ